jgi:hypothetical protein
VSLLEMPQFNAYIFNVMVRELFLFKQKIFEAIEERGGNAVLTEDEADSAYYVLPTRGTVARPWD